MGSPLSSELAYGANRVELYRYVNYFALFVLEMYWIESKKYSILDYFLVSLTYCFVVSL